MHVVDLSDDWAIAPVAARGNFEGAAEMIFHRSINEGWPRPAGVKFDQVKSELRSQLREALTNEGFSLVD